MAKLNSWADSNIHVVEHLVSCGCVVSSLQCDLARVIEVDFEGRTLILLMVWYYFQDFQPHFPSACHHFFTVVTDRGYQYMCSLSSCNLSKPAKELMFYLPEAVRPKLLSQLITERVAIDTPCELDLDCPFYSQYYTRLHSDKFRQVSCASLKTATN